MTNDTRRVLMPLTSTQDQVFGCLHVWTRTGCPWMPPVRAIIHVRTRPSLAACFLPTDLPDYAFIICSRHCAVFTFTADSFRVQAGRYQYRLTAWNSYGWSLPVHISNCSVLRSPCQSPLLHIAWSSPAATGVWVVLFSLLAIGASTLAMKSNITVRLLAQAIDQAGSSAPQF